MSFHTTSAASEASQMSVQVNGPPSLVEPSTATANGPDEVENGSSSGDAAILNLRVDSDNDSAVGDVESLASSTASLSTTMYQSVEENGRTYHRYKEGSYLLPNDALEQDRLDLQHNLCKLTLHGKLHLAPIGTGPQNVLDFGTGTGIWAVEFAQEFPSASVLGTDLSPIQPLYVPPNCRFEVDDAEDEWVFSHKFDYIHGRLMAFGLRDPAAVFKRAFDSLTPGGYLEMFDAELPLRCIDDSLDGSALINFSNMMVEGARRLGKDLTRVPYYKSYFEAAGFVDIVEEHFQWPINTWPKSQYHKTLGLWFNHDLLDGLSGIAMAILTRAFQKSREEVEVLLVDVRKDLKNRKIHAYQPMHVVYGRKPQ